MANDLTNLTPQILADILSVLRENSVMPSLVNNMYSTNAAAQGSTIDINDIADMTVYDVTPGNFPADGVKSDVEATQKQLVLSNFKAVTFDLSDKEFYEIQNGTIPRSLQKAVKALGNSIDQSILDLYKDVYQFTGTAGTTPFASSTAAAQNCSRILSTALAPKEERALVLDEFAYANALGLEVLQKASYANSVETLREAMITRAVGFDWHEDQNVRTHTVTASGDYAIDAAATAGATSLVLDDAAGAAPTAPAVGDIFSIAGNTQTYVVTSVTAATPTANETTVGISPALAADVSDGAVVTFEVTTSHVANLAFHREAFAFASRPMLDMQAPGSILETVTDEVTGLTMRYEVQRLWKKTVFSLDCLWGVTAVRPELAVRLLG